jgi:hypothetical protein
MESAIGSTPPAEFVEPKVLPEWKPFYGAQYALNAPQATMTAPTTTG